METKKKTVKAWAILNIRNYTLAVGDDYKYKMAAICLDTKPKKYHLAVDEMVVPCTISYSIESLSKYG